MFSHFTGLSILFIFIAGQQLLRTHAFLLNNVASEQSMDGLSTTQNIETEPQLSMSKSIILQKIGYNKPTNAAPATYGTTDRTSSDDPRKQANNWYKQQFQSLIVQLDDLNHSIVSFLYKLEGETHTHTNHCIIYVGLGTTMVL